QTTKKFSGKFEITLALRDQQGQAVQLLDAARSLELDNYEATQPESLFVRYAQFLEAPPGKYSLEATITDGVSRGHGFFNAMVEIRDLLAPSLNVSDIVLLDQTPDRSFPEEKQVVPAFRQRFNTTIYAFAQARNVTPGQRLRAVLKIGGVQEAALSQAVLDTIAGAETVNLFFPIPPSQLALGRIQLKLEITSNNANAHTERGLWVRWAQRPNSRVALNDYIEPMRLIMNSKEWKALKSASSPEEQRRLLAEFWSQRKPSAEATANLLEEEFYWRVGESNARFAWGKGDGWESDRGRVYIIHGPPDNVSRRYDQRYGRSLEAWRYESPVREFLFYDEHGDGRFVLIRQTHPI
ncbi:MAG: GWxTD domain-containing protein, partial [candidate division KSB1 bacterium]